jgi:hypothetical protein
MIRRKRSDCNKIFVGGDGGDVADGGDVDESQVKVVML